MDVSGIVSSFPPEKQIVAGTLTQAVEDYKNYKVCRDPAYRWVFEDACAYFGIGFFHCQMCKEKTPSKDAYLAPTRFGAKDRLVCSFCGKKKNGLAYSSGPFNFEFACEVLKLDPGYIRRKLVRNETNT